MPVSLLAVSLRSAKCQRRRKSLPVGRSKSRPFDGAPWCVMPSISEHVPRRVGLYAKLILLCFRDPGFAVIEPIAFTIHFQDVDVVRQPIQQGTCQAF